jgi:hypothetical protein
MKKNKLAWLAALLNIITGLGYIYNGKRKFFGFILLIGYLFVVLEQFYLMYINYPLPDNTSLSFIAGLLFIFAFMYDAYREAKELNKRYP